jgi:hypothetical protein
VEVAEAYVDGRATRMQLEAADAEAVMAWLGRDGKPPIWPTADVSEPDAWQELVNLIHAGVLSIDRRPLLLADIFGNVFSPVVIDPVWLSSTVVKLAEAAYEERELPSGLLDGARLALLADALEEHGCSEAAVLEHLRGPGPHTRGCWALDVFIAAAPRNFV